MIVVILAGGLGARISKKTDINPKPLVEKCTTTAIQSAGIFSAVNINNYGNVDSFLKSLNFYLNKNDYFCKIINSKSWKFEKQ
ncbi:MAG: hypothetical protein LBU51_05605 [Bacteroidales bacterium]|jgi:CTP:phosphocholine cytidylyltransferase-like protein|nr:hypothetical protein [Bacteroidales bacterium]